MVGFPLTPLGERVIDSGAANTCAALEVAMHQAIDDYKYDDAVRWDIARRQVGERYRQMACEFSTYRMYTLELEL